MICEWGMSNEIGPVTFGKNNDEMFLGREISRPKSHGEEISKMIDQEIKNFVLNAENNADILLKKKEKELDSLAQALLDYETIDSKQLAKVLNGESIDDISTKEKSTKKRTRRTSKS